MNTLSKKTFFLLAMLITSFVDADTVVEIDMDRPGDTINKNIYGQFMEHLGRGIYEGIWVGEDSDIPNTNGYRNDVLQALKNLKVPLLRWPGGCFADEYDWRDGIGPRGQRPRRINTLWGGVIDDNAFGTHEFLDLTEMLGADAYVNGNVGTATPRDNAQWLEYMTRDGESTLAQERRANGRDKPWRVHYFGVGNETWGCGGSMTPEYYGNIYKHHATYLKTPEDNTPVLIASGASDANTEWVEQLMQLEPEWSYRLEAISHHHYTISSGNWDKKGNALGFTEQEWMSTMYRTLRIDGFIRSNLKVMDKYDPEQKVGFYIDEWGTWYDVTEGNPGFLYQQNSLRDAVVAALNLNIFHKYAKRIHMTNIAQMINVLQAMILTDKEKMLLTPTYHVFRMHIPFQGATYLPVKLKNNGRYGDREFRVPKISASAARGKYGNLWLTLVNVDPNNPESIDLGSTYQSLTGEILTAEAMDAHNTFENPENIKPAPFNVRSSGGKMSFELPPKSVIVVKVE